MTVQLGVVMNPITQINFKKDTSLALLLEAARRGWQLHYMEPGDLSARQGRAVGRMRDLQVFDNSECWCELGDAQERPLDELDVIFMRQDPPVNSTFIYAAMLLELAEQAGVLIVNRPRALLERNEKLFALKFPELTPPTLVSMQADLIGAFIDEYQDVILKPLDGMGGASIFRVRAEDPNRNVIMETLTRQGSRLTMAQAFVPEISAGDKRVLMIDGEPAPWGLARIPRKGENRGNLAAGGTGKGFELGPAEQHICDVVGPTLRAEGIFFAGLDIIGDRLTEINITSPTCVQEINRAFSVRIEERLLDGIEAKLNSPG